MKQMLLMAVWMASAWVNAAQVPPTGAADAENTIYGVDATVGEDGMAVMSVCLKNSWSVPGFQFDIVAPEGFEVATDEDGFYRIELSTTRTTAKKTDIFSSALQADGSVRVLCASTKNYLFSGNDGEVCTIAFRQQADVAEGRYQVILKNIVITDAEGNTVGPEPAVASLTIPQAQPTVVAFDQTDYHAYKGEESKFQSPAATVTTATGEAVEGATVTYAISENSFATIDAQTGVVTILADAEPGTATVTASFAGIKGYLASEGTYTLHYNKAAYTDIAALKAGAASDELVRVKLTDAQVVYVNGKNVYLRDASAAIELYNMTYPFAEGMVLNGYINATYGLSYGMPRLTAGEVDAVPTEAAVEPYVLNTDDVVAHVGDLVRVNLARVAADGTISNGTQAGLTYYDKFKTGLKAPYEDATVSMTAIVIAYLSKNATEPIYELAPVDAEALTYVFDETSRVATADVATARVELRRSLHEGWNTFCVPFTLTQAQLEDAYGVDVKAKKLAIVDSDNGTLTLQFEAEAEGGIQANVPYLIRVSAPIASTVFTGVTIVKALAEPSTTLSGCTFQACYHSTPVAAEAGNYALSASGGSFKAVAEPMEIPSMQAYIVLPTDGATYLFDYYEPADEVGITGVEAAEAEGEWYNLQGVRMAEPTGKGLYLRGGRKVWVK